VTQETAEQVMARLKMQPIPEEGAWFVAGPRTQGLNAITVLLTDRPDGIHWSRNASLALAPWLGDTLTSIAADPPPPSTDAGG